MDDQWNQNTGGGQPADPTQPPVGGDQGGQQPWSPNPVGGGGAPAPEPTTPEPAAPEPGQAPPVETPAVPSQPAPETPSQGGWDQGGGTDQGTTQ